MMKLAVVIPAYNEASSIAAVLKAVPNSFPGIEEVVKIVVNDNSSDETARIAKEAGAKVVTHRINLGAGGATLTGTIAASRLGADVVVTLDGDGQHDPSEIRDLLKSYQSGDGDIIIGSRFMSESIKKMPGIKNIGNRIMNGITYIFSGKKVSDSQSGFRLFGAKMLSKIDSYITTSGYEFCSEVIINSKRFGLKVAEVPITTIYHEGRQGQNPLNGINILLSLIYRGVSNK